MRQNKKPKQTLESAQYGLEINFNRKDTDRLVFKTLNLLVNGGILK